MIIDTDVLIWYLRGNEKAYHEICAHIPFAVSAVTYMELIQGMKDKRELHLFHKCFRNMRVNVIQISASISIRAVHFVEDYALSHSMELGDAIIAATALENDEILLTGNTKHYSFIPNIQIKKFSAEP